MPIYSKFPVETTRHTQYAGSWYDADASRLRTQLTEYLKQAERRLHTQAPNAVPTGQHLLGIIAPHAGYMFSGQAAAYSYETAKQQPAIKRVFVLGPSHHLPLHGVALPSASSFATPLGNLDVDGNLVSELSSYPLFSIESDVHRVEHSLEMQLPYIKHTLGSVKLVPLVVGMLEDEAEIRLVAEILKGYVRQGDLVVVSSDFTHYGPRYSYTPFEGRFHESVENLDKEAFSYLSRLDLDGFLEFQRRTQSTICGLYPCAVLCAILPSDAQGRLLKYSTSQDVVADDQDNSVSYLAVAFCGSDWPDNPSQRSSISDAIRLTCEDKQALLAITRRALETWVRDKQVIDPLQLSGVKVSAAMQRCYGAFVTLYKKTEDNPEGRRLHDSRELRGCIGNIWPVRPLYQTVVENAIASSSRDQRFSPVSPDELRNLQIEISVLTPPRRVASYNEILLGTDGIILSKHHHQAVFLPFVPTEFGWNLPETLRQLSLKAGLKDNDWQQGCKFDLFQSVSLEE